MPRTTHPKLRLHKATQTAYVELNGHRIYLCKWLTQNNICNYA